MATKRPSPENLLKRAQEEELKLGRGQLKIYLGAAPGVGKTFSMLEDAREKYKQGLDVVIGIAESHGRQEIENLINIFEVLPRKSVEYRETKQLEFDLEGALKRSPALLIIDEMAHSNIPGLRHTKRWQDIKEVLDRGIDVYTTMNIQHVESLNDVVSQIIQTHIKETVPDLMLSLADTIEVVDLPVEDLLKRLQEGKVYFPQQAELAKESFFRKGNLIALRELMLRTAAEHVGADVLLYRQDQGIKTIWPTREKVLVCVGYHQSSSKLIRAAYRIANSLQAELIAVHIDTSSMTSEDQFNINVHLAEQLGTETKILVGTNIVKEIMDFALSENVTKIIIGKKIQPRWRETLFGSLADELVRQSGEIDIFIITGEPEEVKVKKKYVGQQPLIPWKIYGLAGLIILIITTINFLLSSFLSISDIAMIYILGVTAIALFGNITVSALASILSVLAFDYFFIPTRYSFFMSNLEYFLTLLVMLTVSLIISNLTIITRNQAKRALLAEKRSSTLHSLSRQLTSVRGIDKLLEIAVKEIGKAFDCEVLALLAQDGELVVRGENIDAIKLDDKEKSIAQWVYSLGQAAGFGTDTLSYFDALYLPLITTQGTIGVLRIRPLFPGKILTPDQQHLLEAFANQIALALEADKIQEVAQKLELKHERRRVRSTLLQSISHDIRSPLIAIMSNASTLLASESGFDLKNVRKVAQDIYLDSEQLSRLINNLIQITLLESKKFKVKKKLNSLNDSIHSVLHSSSKKLKKNTVQLKLDPNLPIIKFDNNLLEDVIINLLDNAVKFTPENTLIEISTIFENNRIIFKISDKGPGISSDEVDKLFKKFYRGRMLTTQRGLGLGLAICRKIIKTHKGKIWAENRKEGGACFCFYLPVNGGKE